MLLYQRYLVEAKNYYQDGSVEKFLIDSVSMKRHEAGTFAYTISIIYLILKAYKEGIETAFEEDTTNLALNRSFQHEIAALMEFIEIKLTDTIVVSFDTRYSRTFDQIDFVLLKNLQEKPRKLAGDFSHACAAIYLLLGECYHHYQSHVEEQTLFNASYCAVQTLHTKLREVTLDILNNFIVPMRVLENAPSLNARFEFYLLLARKTKANSSLQAIIAALETYIVRFKWVGYMPVPTLRTHRTHITNIIAEINNGRINLKEVLNIIAELATTPDGEFQHLLVGIYSAFAEEGREGFAIAIAQCLVTIGRADKMSVYDYYRKYIARNHQPEAYKLYLRLLTMIGPELRKSTEQIALLCIGKIDTSLKARYLPMFPDEITEDSELAKLAKQASHLAAPSAPLTRLLTSLSPTHAKAKTHEENLNALVATLITLTEARMRITTDILFSRLKELSYFLCAVYNLLQVAGFDRLSADLGKVAVAKFAPSADDTEAITMLSIAELQAYWSDDGLACARDTVSFIGKGGSHVTSKTDDRALADFSDSDSDIGLGDRHHPPAADSPTPPDRSDSMTTLSTTGSLKPAPGLPTLLPTAEYSLFSAVHRRPQPPRTLDDRLVMVTPALDVPALGGKLRA